MERLFRVGISVTKADRKGDIIRLMSAGSQASAATSEDAINQIEEFIKKVSYISNGKFDAYGCIFCQDEVTGKIIKSMPLV